MSVRRIVANLAADDIDASIGFYRDILGLAVVMDHGWIVTLGSDAVQTVQISLAREGGSGTPVPDLSVEVDDLDAVMMRVRRAGGVPAYGPVDEPWGVRRFFVADPQGRLVNVLQHH